MIFKNREIIKESPNMKTKVIPSEIKLCKSAETSRLTFRK